LADGAAVTDRVSRGDLPCHESWQCPFTDRPKLDALFAGLEDGARDARNVLIRQALHGHGYTLKEIADYLGLHYTTVSKAANGDG